MEHRLRALPLLLVLLAAAAPAQAAAAQRLAVLTLTAPWTPDCQGVAWRKDRELRERCPVLETLADEARAGALAALDGRDVDVMTRENTAQLLKEMGASAACTAEGECEVETAKLIGADYVVSGTLTTVEKTWFVTMKLHAVRTAKLLRTSDPLMGRSQVELIVKVRAAAEAMVRAGLKLGAGSAAAVPAPPAPAPGRPPPGEGRVDAPPPAAFADEADEVVVAFESTPDAAVVRVDGRLLCSATPCRKRLAAGAHEAVFEKERHAAATQRFTAARGATVKAALAPRFGWVSVETATPGIAVAIDGAEVGKTPVAAREVDEGSAEVVIADPCFLREGERIAVKAGERRTVRLEPKPRLAGLRVNAEDEKGNAVDADVTVDGAVAGAAGAVLKVPVCARKLKVPLGNVTFEADLKLEEGKVAVIVARPSAPPPSARIVPAPVVVDGMARVPGGTYTSGEAKKKVTVEPFLLDVTEVTVEAYAACAEAGDCDAAPSTAYWKGISGEMKTWSRGVCNQAKPERLKHPVNCVDWKQASAYCAAMGKRLPTEEEWEWAARGGERGTAYPWGDEAPSSQLCWGRNVRDRKATGLDGTCAVGSYPAGDSPHGVKDLAGGVWEWTSTARGEARAARGGSWTDGDGPLVSAARTSTSDPSTRSYYYGFRCAKSP